MIKILVLLAALWTGAAHAQSVQQSGTVTPGHAAQWVTNGVVKDGGTAANGSLTSLGVTQSGSGICQNSALTTSAGYQQICLGVTTAGGGYLSVQNFGTAVAQGLTLNINGTPVTIPTGGNTLATVTLPLVNNGLVCGDGTLGLLKNCFVTVPISAGGTGATTASGARTNLGLGTLATQDASAVAITGGTITGMPSPSVNSDVANKQYVDSVATGLHSLVAARLGTAAVLPNSPTYANGASGVGATLTAGSNVALTVDGTAVVLADRILVKNQASSVQNGVYAVTVVGDGSTAWVLTRATDFDTSGEMVAGSYILVTAGSTLTGSSWVLQNTVTTVGSTGVNFNQFSTPGVSSFNSRVGAITPQADDYAALDGLALKNCTLAGSVSASALTIALKTAGGSDPSSSSPCVVVFRNATAATGTTSAITVTAATSLAISSGSTLGTTNGIPFRIWITGFNDAGTFRLGAIKASGASNFYSLDESLLISSTAEGGAGGADSAGVFYTGTAVSSKAYRTLGFMTWNSGLATAGTWSAGPDVIQLYSMGMAKPGQPIGNSISATAVAGGNCNTTSSYVDSTLTATITPKSAANYIQAYWNGNIQTTAANQVGAAVMRRGGSVLGIGGEVFSETGRAIGSAGGSPVDQALVTTAVAFTVGCLSGDNVNPVIFPTNGGGISGQGGQIVLTELQG